MVPGGDMLVHLDLLRARRGGTVEPGMTAEVTNFPKRGENRPVSLTNSRYPLFPLAYARALKAQHPDIWAKGGNIRGNDQFRILSRVAARGGPPQTDEERDAIRLREAWAARHLMDFRLPGIVAQIKWLVIGEQGLAEMTRVVAGRAEMTRDAKTLRRDSGLRRVPFVSFVLRAPFHTESVRATRRQLVQSRGMTREQVWKALWSDPKYIRLHERKDRIGKAWNEADANKRPEATHLSEQFTRANKAIQRYEDAALKDAKVSPAPAPRARPHR